MDAPGAAEQHALEQERAAHPAPEDTDSEPPSPPGPDDGDDALSPDAVLDALDASENAPDVEAPDSEL